MANELKTAYPSGSNMYACIRNEANAVLYIVGAAFETWGASGRDAADYGIDQTSDTGDMYVADFPTGTAAGHYYVTSYLWDGVTKADTDDVMPPGGEIWWDGTSEQTETEYELIAYDAAKVNDILSVLNIYDDTGNLQVGGVAPIIESNPGEGVYP